jgi:hypothetical protein
MTVPKHLEGAVRKIVLSGLSWQKDRASAEEQVEIEAARAWLNFNLTKANCEPLLDRTAEKTQTFSKQQALEDSARCQDAAKEIKRGDYDIPDLS